MRRRSFDRPAIVTGIALAAVSMLPVQAWAVMRAEGPGGNAVAALAGHVASPVAAAALPADVEDAGDSIVRHAVHVDAHDARLAGQARRDGRRTDEARDRFEERFPAQATATQDTREPATTRWAVLIGINEHLGRVRDNYGSRQDAEELRQHLLNLGWRDDHIVLLTDTDATGEAMVEAFEWLARKTDEDSVAIVHYSGHSKKWYDQDHDGDGEVTDEALWPTDDAFIDDSVFVSLLDRVRAGALWVNIGACNSEGFNDPGLARDGRILTFSSRESQKSYEDPSVDNSVWGHYLTDQALLQGQGDLNGDGTVTVEEAFNYATPRAAQRTEGQRYGRQDAVVVDLVDGDFSLEIPPPPAPPRDESKDEADDGLLCPWLCEER